MNKVAHVAAGVVERKAAKAKKKMRKKIRKKIFKSLLWTVLVLCLGIWIGIHRNVIKAWAKGEKLPEMPEGHCKTPLHRLFK